MRTWLVAAWLTAVSLLGAPTSAFPEDPILLELQATVRSVPGTENVLTETYPGREAPNAGFIEPGVYCSLWTGECVEIKQPTVIFTGYWLDADREMVELVALHELGHWRQWAEGRPMDEWDADVYAVQTMCRRGHDGLAIMERTARMLLAAYDISWSEGHTEAHGSWYERLENAKQRASACRRQNEAA